MRLANLDWDLSLMEGITSVDIDRKYLLLLKQVISLGITRTQLKWIV